MALTFNLETDDQSRIQVLSVMGEVDIATVDELGVMIETLADHDYDLVLDLTSTDFMDSSGLRLLVSTRDRLVGAGKRFKVAVAGGPISRLLEVTGLLSHLEVHQTVEEATSA